MSRQDTYDLPATSVEKQSRRITHGHLRAPERAALRALVRAPRECRRAWWTLYTKFRRDRERKQKSRVRV